MRVRRTLVTVLLAAVSITVVGGPAWGGTDVAAPVSAEDRDRYALEPVTEPEPVSGSELDHVMDMRRHLGVPRSRAFVRRLHAHPAAFGAVRSEASFFANQLVTPDEVPWLIVRQELEWQGGDGRRAAEAVLGPTFAGSFPSGRHYVVQCAGCDVAAAQAQLASADLPSPLREHVDVRSVRYSLADLERYRVEVDALLAGTDVAAGSGVMTMDNRVQLDVGVGYRKLARLVRERFGDPGPVVVVRNQYRDLRDPEPVSLTGARTDGQRGLVLSFVGAQEVTDRRNACQLDYDATAEAGRGAVTVAVRPVYRAVHRAGGSGECDAMGYGRLVSVRLARPLGTRTLVDGATGDPVPVFDGSTRLRPTWLPAGWELRNESGGGCWSSDPVPCWTQIWGTLESEDAASCPSGSGYVELAQAVGRQDDIATVADDSVTVSPATVRGASAEVQTDTRGYGSVTVRWREGDQSLVLSGGSSCAGAPAPTPEVVTRIADSLR